MIRCATPGREAVRQRHQPIDNLVEAIFQPWLSLVSRLPEAGYYLDAPGLPSATAVSGLSSCSRPARGAVAGAPKRHDGRVLFPERSHAVATMRSTGSQPS